MRKMISIALIAAFLLLFVALLAPAQTTRPASGLAGEVQALLDRLAALEAAPTVPPTVRTFGATGDGRTDDTAAFREAISQTAATGGVVRVPPGTYRLTGTLSLPSDVQLVGEGESSRLVVAADKWTLGHSLLDFDGAADAAIRDLRIDAQGELRHTNQSTGPLVRIRNDARHVRIERVTFVGSGLRPYDSGGKVAQYPSGPAVYIEACSDNTVRGCRFEQSGGERAAQFAFAVSVSTIDGGTAQRNRIEGNTFAGSWNWNVVEVAGPGSRFNHVSGNYFVDCRTLMMIDFDKGASFNSATGNTVAGGGKASPHIGNTKTRFGAIADHGSDAYGAYPASTNLGNQISGNTVHGLDSASTDGAESLIYLQRTEGGLYTGNVLCGLNGGRVGVGVWLDAGVRGAKVRSNQISEVKAPSFTVPASRGGGNVVDE